MRLKLLTNRAVDQSLLAEEPRGGGRPFPSETPRHGGSPHPAQWQMQNPNDCGLSFTGWRNERRDWGEGAMDFKSLSNEEGIDRRQALSMMWEKFYEENRVFIESSSKDSEDYRIQLFAIFFADMVVQNMGRFQWLYDATKKARHTPIPARVWFDENKGICPTCGLDMNNLLGKDDFSVVPHINGTCKG